MGEKLLSFHFAENLNQKHPLYIRTSPEGAPAAVGPAAWFSITRDEVRPAGSFPAQLVQQA